MKETKNAYLALSKAIKIASLREFTKVGKRAMPIIYIAFFTSYEYPITLLNMLINKKQILVEKKLKSMPFDKNLLAFAGSLDISLITKLSRPNKEINSKIQYMARTREYFPNSSGPNIRAIDIAKIKKEIGRVIFRDSIARLFLTMDLVHDMGLI